MRDVIRQIQRNSPTLIGVIDLMAGVAVRAIGGRRAEYRPLVSPLCGSSDPRTIALAYRKRHGIDELYIADLDAILGRDSNASIVAELAREGFRIALDAGLRAAADAKPWFELGISSIVAALETISHPNVLDELVEQVGPERVVFSLDLSGGVPLGDLTAWGEDTAEPEVTIRIAERALQSGLTRMIVLDLKTVGTATGPATMKLCRALRAQWPHATLWTGGGIRSRADLKVLHDAGIEGALVASALHAETL